MTKIHGQWWGLAVVAAIVAVLLGVWAATDGGPPRPSPPAVARSGFPGRALGRTLGFRLRAASARRRAGSVSASPPRSARCPGSSVSGSC